VILLFSLFLHCFLWKNEAEVDKKVFSISKMYLQSSGCSIIIEQPE
jgi:hypothetical protein